MNNYNFQNSTTALSLQPHTDFAKRAKQFGVAGLLIAIGGPLLPLGLTLQILFAFIGACMLLQGAYDWYQSSIIIVFDKKAKMIFRKRGAKETQLLAFDEAAISSTSINNRRFYYSIVPKKDRYQRGIAISHFYAKKDAAAKEQYEKEILPLITQIIS